MKNHITLLKKKKLTVTPQRLELLSVLSINAHISIEDIYKLLSVTFPSVSLATVYKNVNNMLEKELLMEVQIPNKKNVYELIKEEHSHVNCVKCGEILDLILNTNDIYKEAEQKSSFKLNSNAIIFNGLCANC